LLEECIKKILGRIQWLEYLIDKGENIKIIIQRNELKKAVYVGDTIGDLEAANYADTPFIYASYGFGQLNDVKYSINNISDINRIVCNII